MKPLTHYIQEKLVIKKNKSKNYKYFPQTKKELQDIIKKRIEQEGSEVDLNDIDVSNITDMSDLFLRKDFNGNISSWDVSNVKNMDEMFVNCFKFNKDISLWDVSNVKNMAEMFFGCEKFNSDISNWDVSSVTDMTSMFNGCKSFNQDISSWDVSKVKGHYFIFINCGIQDKYKPKFRYIR